MQVVTAGNEKYVSNVRIANLVELQSEYGPISFCSLPVDVPHEMLSPYENTGQPMYWLDGLIADAVGFIVDGKFFVSEANDKETNTAAPICQLRLL